MSNKFFRKERPYKSVDVNGAFTFDFYVKEGVLSGTYMHIYTRDRQWGLKVAGNCHAFGYLLEAARQNNIANLHGYAMLLWSQSQLLTTEQQLADDISQAIIRWHERMEARAAEQAAKVTDTEENAAQAFMEGVAEYADAAPNERESMRRQWREDVKKAIREVNGHDSTEEK